MNHITKRTITALTVVAIVVLALIFVPSLYIAPILWLLVILVHLEFSKMVSKKYEILVCPGVLIGAIYLACLLLPYYVQSWRLLPLIPLSLILLVFSFLWIKAERPLEVIGTTLFGIFYIPVMLTPLFIVLLNDFSSHNLLFLYYIAIIKISDMGGFAFGIAFGKHKMCPSISPNKSWEGMAGSIFASSLISCAFIPLTQFSFFKAILFGIAAAVFGTLGDLVESRLKRDVGVKDSSQFSWTNGMGGFLDMFDSLIFASAILFMFSEFWR